MRSVSVSELRKNLSQNLTAVTRHNDVLQVRAKSGNAVLLSENDYNSLRETIYIMSQPNLVSNIKEGEKEDLSKMSKFDSSEEW